MILLDSVIMLTLKRSGALIGLMMGYGRPTLRYQNHLREFTSHCGKNFMKKQFKDYWEMDQYIRTKIQSGISVADMMVIGDEVKKLESGQIYLEIGVSEGA